MSSLFMIGRSSAFCTRVGSSAFFGTNFPISVCCQQTKKLFSAPKSGPNITRGLCWTSRNKLLMSKTRGGLPWPNRGYSTEWTAICKKRGGGGGSETHYMDVKNQWSMEETSWVLALRSSRETQNKLEGASRTKPVLKEWQHEMAAAGQEKLREQFSVKLKKVDNDTRTESTSSAAIIKFACWLWVDVPF